MILLSDKVYTEKYINVDTSRCKRLTLSLDVINGHPNES